MYYNARKKNLLCILFIIGVSSKSLWKTSHVSHPTDKSKISQFQHRTARYLTIFPCKRQSQWNINRSIIKNHRASLSVFYWGFAANREMYHLLILFSYPFSASIKKLMLFSISVWHTVPRHYQYFSKFRYYCI